MHHFEVRMICVPVWFIIDRRFVVECVEDVDVIQLRLNRCSVGEDVLVVVLIPSHELKKDEVIGTTNDG